MLRYLSNKVSEIYFKYIYVHFDSHELNLDYHDQVAWIELAHSLSADIKLHYDYDLSLLPYGLHKHGVKDGYSKVIDWVLGGRPAQLYRYGFIVQVDDSYHHQYVILRVELTKNVPHIILDNKRLSHPQGGLSHNLHPFVLEGHFPKDFTVYTKKGAHIDMLSIITPDVMYDAINNSVISDIELKGKYMYFIGSLQWGDEISEAKKIINYAKKFLREVEQQIN